MTFNERRRQVRSMRSPLRWRRQLAIESRGDVDVD